MVTLLTIGEFNYMTTRIMYFQNMFRKTPSSLWKPHASTSLLCQASHGAELLHHATLEVAAL